MLEFICGSRNILVQFYWRCGILFVLFIYNDISEQLRYKYKGSSALSLINYTLVI
jgi:hypothetical protein